MTVDYGFDMWGTTDLSPTLQDISGAELMAQVICRRWFTPPGVMISDPDATTVDLRSYLSTEQDLDARSIARIKGAASSAALADPRVYSITVTADYDPDLEMLTVTGQGFGADGPFRLTVGVSSVTVELLNSN